MHSHLFRLSQLDPQDVSEAGFRVKATQTNFPALQNMSFYRLVLHAKGIREPHWHANADELGYCLKGKVLVSLYGNKNTKEEFIVSQGGAFWIPSGALHGVENVGEESAELLLQFSSEEPEDFGLSSAFGMFSAAVLGNTWDVSSKHFQGLKRSTQPTFIAKRETPAPLLKDYHYTSSYQFDLEGSSPLIANKGGTAKVARQNVWPVLQKQALYSLLLTGEGMREPHWHPETAEMGYVASGNGRMSILSPSGKVDTYQMEAGDLYFIPKAYPHHIENLTDSDLHILIFFDQPMPQDIGFSGSVKSFSDATLSQVLHCPTDLVATLPTYYEDLFIVGKKNPLDAS